MKSSKTSHPFPKACGAVGSFPVGGKTRASSMNLVKPQESAFALRNAKYVAFRLRMLLFWLTAIIAGADGLISAAVEKVTL